jgi:hypothetical protein
VAFIVVGGGQLLSLVRRLSGFVSGFAFGWHLRSRVSILHWSSTYTQCVFLISMHTQKAYNGFTHIVCTRSRTIISILKMAVKTCKHTLCALKIMISKYSIMEVFFTNPHNVWI